MPVGALNSAMISLACARSHSNQHWLAVRDCEPVNALNVFSARWNFVASLVCERIAST